MVSFVFLVGCPLVEDPDIFVDEWGRKVDVDLSGKVQDMGKFVSTYVAY